MMSCDSNDGELKLTEEYKYLLSYIRPLIDQLDKSRDAQLCLLWLSKLEQCASWERHHRNRILSELCKQVKSHCLKPPFNVSPPNGPLQNVILKDWKTRNWVIHEVSEIEGSTEEVFSSSSQHSFRSLKNIHKPTASSHVWKVGHNHDKARTSPKNKPIKQTKDLDHCECFAIQKAYHDRAQSDQMVIEKYQEIIKSLVSQQLKADISPSRLKKLQTTYEVKMGELIHAFKRAQEENEVLRRRWEEDSEKVLVLKEENEDLRKQVFDLEMAKNAIDAKYKSCEEEKLLKLTDLISKLNETEKKLKEREKRCNSLERKYEDYRTFETEFRERLNEKDMVHAAELSSLERILEEKRGEINSLKEELTNQCVHFKQEISLLKQQISEGPNSKKDDKNKMKTYRVKAKKLEKLREHMTALFQYQLQQILAKKDFYISTLEMQLKMNKSDTGGSISNCDFNNTLDQKVTQLEAQYKKLIEESEQEYIKRRQLDLQKIHALEKQLLSFGEATEGKELDSDQKDCLSRRTVSDVESSNNDGSFLNRS